MSYNMILVPLKFLYKLEQILDGNLDEIIDALVTADQAAKLAGQND